MKVFISWSGERSLVIARALRDWIPRVIQVVQPFMSETDLGKGVRWEQEIGSQLEQTKFGVFCLTPENLDSRWINFEAGALSKTVERTYVCTYLLDLKPTDIEGPLSKFNHTRLEKEDTRRLIQTIYQASENKTLSENIVSDTFDVWWPKLEEKLSYIPSVGGSKKPQRKLEDMVEEILSIVRSQGSERAWRDSTTDSYLLKFLPAFQLALQNDPNYRLSPELLDALQSIELDTRWDSLRRRGFMPAHRSKQRSIFDFVDEAAKAQTGDLGSNESISARVETDHQAEDTSNENPDS